MSVFFLKVIIFIIHIFFTLGQAFHRYIGLTRPLLRGKIRTMYKLRRYSKKDKYSYTIGAFPTYELIEKRPDLVEVVYVHTDYNEKDRLFSYGKKHGFHVEINHKAINRLANKDNAYVVGVFRKFHSQLEDRPHIVLHEVSDMGNLGTILRTMNGFDYKDLVLIGQVCDVFNPKTVRASMGSIFDIRIAFFDDMESYLLAFPNHKKYLFMLSRNPSDSLYKVENRLDQKDVYALVFGNEGAGLPTNFSKLGEVVFIPQSDRIDSLNLPIAAALAMYEFRR